MERRCEVETQIHPDKQQMLDVLLHPRQFSDVYNQGKETIKKVHEHLAGCSDCLKICQENIKFY